MNNEKYEYIVLTNPEKKQLYIYVASGEIEVIRKSVSEHYHVGDDCDVRMYRIPKKGMRIARKYLKGTIK